MPRAGPTNNLFRFDTASPAWVGLNGPPLGVPPPPRYEHGMTAIGAALFVFGGYGNAGEPGRAAVRWQKVRLVCCELVLVRARSCW